MDLTAGRSRMECCVKSPEQGAREGVSFIQNHIIEATDKAFDDFAGAEGSIERLTGRY